MQIEAGKFYKTRDGSKVGPAILRTRDQDGWSVARGHPWACGTGFMHYPDGTCAYTKAPHLDLISEWGDTTGPVVEETVTAHRIVPGVYGRLDIAPGMLKSPTVLMGIEDGIDTQLTHWTASELRAAAAVLSQLADALEQN